MRAGCGELVGILDGEFTECASSVGVLEGNGMSCGTASEAESEGFGASEGGEASLGRFAAGSSDGGVDIGAFCSLFFRPKKL